MIPQRTFVLILTLVSALGWSEQNTNWTLQETAGRESKTITYQRFSSPEGQRLVCRKGERTLTTDLDASGNTLRWRKTDASGRTIELTRDGSDYVVRTPQGTTSFASRGLRWLQDQHQLGRFVLGVETEVRFVAFADLLDARLKASDMTIFKATKVQKEPQQWATGSAPTWKVRVTFDDLRSAFWSAHYWFRASDGQLVRYEEVRGGPGTPVTVGILVSEEG